MIYSGLHCLVLTLKIKKMPIEIKELHIKINVDEKASSAATTTAVDQGQIMRAISESVEQIMNIEQRKKER